MKISSFILTVSVLANIALAALIVAHTSDRARPGAEQSPSSEAKNNPGMAAGASAGNGSANVDPKLWEGLSEGDYPALVARLRAQGFPPSVVRAIISAQVSESFAARRKALTPEKTGVPFWQIEKPADPKTLAALRELSREQTNLMKELLGDNGAPDIDPMYAANQQRQFGNLSADKVEQMKKVQADYGELRQEIYTAAGIGGGAITLTPQERAKLALLEKEQEADIRQLLTPQELEDYQLRSSNTANIMRYNLMSFGPTEQEFRTIFPLQKAFDEQYRSQMMESPSPEAMRQRREAEKQLTAQIAAVLGPERGPEYERAVDSNYRQIYNVVTRLELPKEVATEVWTLQKDVEQRTATLNRNPALTPAARAEQLAAINQEVTTKLTGALGQRGLDVYKQHGGYWLQNLTPRPGMPAMRGNGQIHVGP